MHKIYWPFEHKGIIQLDEFESKHLIKVMRKQVGEAVLLLDGDGRKTKAIIVDDHQKNCKVETAETEIIESRSPTRLCIAIAPTKSMDRLEWFVEKATEIGVDEIQLLLTERSERKTVKLERLLKVMVAALKQSGQSFLPQLHDMVKFEEFVSHHPGGLIAWCPKRLDAITLSEALRGKQEVNLLIGPEGDFTDKEARLALENGYTPVSLGNSILRTETAAVFACSVINSF